MEDEIQSNQVETMLYGVKTKEINQAVKNNPDKFPKNYVLMPENPEKKVTKKELVPLGTGSLKDSII